MRRQGNALAAVLCLTAALSCGGLWVPAAAADTITAMEYYIDTDPGVGSAIPIPPLDGSYNSGTETGQVNVDTTGLAPGPHLVYVRALSSSGVWGTYPPQLLNVDQSTTTVARVECYISTDPGPGNGMPLAAVDGSFNSISEAVTGSISTVGHSVGNHSLYVRACSSAGIWGPARAMSIQILPAVTVSAAQCGFGGPSDTTPTMGTNTMQAADGAFDSTLENLVLTTNAPSAVGTYRIFVRAEDDNMWIRAENGQGMWSPWSYTTFQVVPVEQNPGVRTNQFGTNQFGFTIFGSSGLTIEVLVCTDIAHPIWVTNQTIILTNPLFYFSDPQWKTCPARFYRLRSP